MVDDIIKDIWSWAILNSAHNKYDTLEELYDAYWKDQLNTSDDELYCDGSSEPFTDWDYASPQPEVSERWDLN